MRDREYITRFQSGDYQAFEFLYHQYVDQIFAFLYRKTSDRMIAEDLCSMVWIKALKSLQFFGEKENANFKSWIYKIAHNTVIDYYRTEKKDVQLEEMYMYGISPDFAEKIDAKEKLSDIRAFLDSLTPIEKEIFILRIWDDLNYKCISHLLDKTPDTCRKIFSRTLKKIKANFVVFLFIFLAL